MDQINCEAVSMNKKKVEVQWATMGSEPSTLHDCLMLLEPDNNLRLNV